jgi:glycosyltransferase involved in cell wall biosynthesis
MRNLLYIGNQLEVRGGSPTAIDVLAPLLKKEGFKVKTASDKKNKLLRLLHMLQYVYANRHWANYAIIDTYSTRNFWYAVLSARLCRKLNLDYLLILHGGNLPRRLKNNPRLSKSLFQKAKLNIAPSRYLFEEFQQSGIKNLKYIPNSIFLENYSFKERKVLKPKLLWVRAFDEIYNPLLALKVLKDLLEYFPKGELCMVGPEKDKTFKECVNYAKTHNLPVEFTRKLSKPEWIKLSRNYDIFLNSTNIDNTPVSLIEAMALGIPIVSTNVGGIPYLLEHKKTGLLVSPGDEQAMLLAVKSLLNNPDLAEKLSRNARHQAESYDWKTVKEDWKEVLKSVGSSSFQ